MLCSAIINFGSKPVVVVDEHERTTRRRKKRNHCYALVALLLRIHYALALEFFFNTLKLCYSLDIVVLHKILPILRSIVWFTLHFPLLIASVARNFCTSHNHNSIIRHRSDFIWQDGTLQVWLVHMSVHALSILLGMKPNCVSLILELSKTT